MQTRLPFPPAHKLGLAWQVGVCLRLCAVLLVGLHAASSWANSTFATLSGTVDKVLDGDSVIIQSASGQSLEVRLADIDAPEYGQAFGEQAKAALSNICLRKPVTWQLKELDQYGRSVAWIRCQGLDANRYMVEQGMAWVYRKFAKQPEWLALERNARKAKRGLWSAPKPTPPWVWRRQQRP